MRSSFQGRILFFSEKFRSPIIRSRHKRTYFWQAVNSWNKPLEPLPIRLEQNILAQGEGHTNLRLFFDILSKKVYIVYCRKSLRSFPSENRTKPSYLEKNYPGWNILSYHCKSQVWILWVFFWNIFWSNFIFVTKFRNIYSSTVQN
jgi:hypothetical protein